MVTITLPVKNYLAKYIRVHYEQSTEDGAVRLPSSGILYNSLYQLTTKRPKGASWKDEGNLTLILPHPAIGKSPDIYNYLSRENAQILEKKSNGS
ncbi:hypothetical protein [Bacteroides sp.]|uniref:hypothetical protein n=1 Tax=Bacteroides sp. TaxID=29523 RepID=UPI0026138EE1|nr:hypothetical protein [Bacteroides sp.]